MLQASQTGRGHFTVQARLVEGGKNHPGTATPFQERPGTFLKR